MSKAPVIAFLVLALPVANASGSDDDIYVIVVKSAAIAANKESGAAWDFPLVGTKALPDPYVKAWVTDRKNAQADYGETGVEWDTLTPTWNKDLVKAKLWHWVKVEVWDKDVKYDDLIGRYHFPLTEKRIADGSFTLKFDQVRSIHFELRRDKQARNDPRVILQQPFPGPRSADEVTRSPGRRDAVILLPGLDLRDDGDSPAKPRFVDWQGSTSPLVKAFSRHADVFSVCYAQTSPVEEIASFPELRDAVGKIKRLGYDNITMLGHSAGGLIARHFVEEHPQLGVTKVIQIAAPNGGTKLAYWGVNLLQVPKDQERFVESMSPGHRAEVLKSREKKSIPASIDFVAAVCCTSPTSRGDGAVNRHCQWPVDLQNQGVPCVCLTGSHNEVMAHEDCLKVYCRLLTQPQPRWGTTQVQQFAVSVR